MIHCDRKELLQAIQILSSILPAKSPKPVLENVMFQPHHNQLYLYGTDLEVSMKIALKKVEVTGEEEFLVPGVKLLGILRETEADTIQLTVEDNFCHISAGEDFYKIFSLSPSEFPAIPSLPEQETFKISSEKLKQMLLRTSFAAAKEASRYTMNSLLFDIKPSQLKIIATDGKRLAMIKSNIEVEKEFFLLLPLKGVQQIEKILSVQEEELSIFIQENQFLLKTENAMLSIRLLQGTYPPYENVIPQNFPHLVSLHGPTFFRALKKSSLLTTHDSKSVRLCFEEKLLTIYSNDPNIGKSKIPISLNSSISEKLEISFNPVFFMEILRVLDKDEIVIELQDSGSPGIIREGEEYIYVVMPLNA